MEQHLSIQTADAMQLQLPIAGVGGRSYAFIIDWHIRFLFLMLWFIAVPLFFGQLFNLYEFFTGVFDGAWWFILLVMGPPIAVYVLYHPVLEWLMKGRTPGKRMAGVRIVTLDGHSPGVGAILVRNLFRVVDSLPAGYLLGLISASVTKNSVRIGDIASGTLLVYEEKVEKNLLHNLSGMGVKPNVDARQWEIIHELLNRWNSLEGDKRRRLAVQLLGSLGETPPQEADRRELDRRLHKRLKSLFEGG